MGRRHLSLSTYLIVAALAHVTAASLLPHAQPAGEPERQRSTDEAALEIEVERAIAEAPAPTALAAAEPSAPRARARANGATRPRPVVEPTADGAELPAPNGSAAPASEWSFSPTAAGSARPNVLGLNEHTGALARLGGVTVESAPRDAAGLAGALDAIDRARGAARGGPLKDAVEEAARSPNAPAEGSAVFAIVVGPSHLATTRLLEASSDEAGWAALRAAIDVAARQKTLRFPVGRPNDALRVVVRVSAEQRFPNGQRVRDLGAHVSKTELGLKDDAAPGESKLTLPSATLHLRGKVCSLSLTLGVSASPIAGGCDPEAIGARSARRVRTEIVSEERISLAEPR